MSPTPSGRGDLTPQRHGSMHQAGRGASGSGPEPDGQPARHHHRKRTRERSPPRRRRSHRTSPERKRRRRNSSPGSYDRVQSDEEEGSRSRPRRRHARSPSSSSSSSQGSRPSSRGSSGRSHGRRSSRSPSSGSSSSTHRSRTTHARRHAPRRSHSRNRRSRSERHIHRVQETTKGPRRPQLVRGKQAKADCYSIPDPIRKKFQEGWTTHIPLNYLPDKAVAEYGCDTLSLLTDMYAVDPARGLIQAEKVLPSAGELKLSFGEWHQAWKRLLQLIKAYFPRDYERWKKHFRRICCTDGATSENWTLWLAYDAEVRRRCHLEGIDPGTFHKNIWKKVEPTHIKAQVMASLQPFRAQTASRSSGARPEQSSRHASGRAQLSSPKPIDSKCFFCGGKGHKASACKADRLINGQPVRLTRGEDRLVKDDKGRQYCFYFNMAGGCTKKDAGPCAKGDHRCTLCGGTNHGAQLCTVVC
ncbi:hypothetical protein PUNSTDRAFT_139604 [Punctularia strigosozonata HHB-11173 SS5]|uniref:CCHC-type domain-containing protein n=1 Tax=Punctularia strigosozonata (strain HHB-11173) TaxID=741275 RepID=R7RZG3_PUNST|nr:uncharacterized protein PUNSTDRAFT_139604 [Punctularia strigosozonata HHB-11173 SS5]EIN03378.1 hypothetical protein PUNSTDRAFT_139604 [Punctularia strigosozonata HHB-11173 SS5]